MQNDLDITKVLRVYEWVRQQGEQQAEGYRYQAMLATSDYDGYTVYLSAYFVTLTVGFHQTYRWEYDKNSDKERFCQLLEQLYREASQS